MFSSSPNRTSSVVTTSLTTLLALGALNCHSQENDCVVRIPTVQLDGSVSIDLSDYRATGIAPQGPEGKLDSCVWRVETLDNQGNTLSIPFEGSSDQNIVSRGAVNFNETRSNNALIMDSNGGLYFEANNSHTIIWIKPRSKVFSPGTLTARVNTQNTQTAVSFLHAMHALRRVNMESVPVPVNVNLNLAAGDTYESAKMVGNVFSYNTTALSDPSISPLNKCYKVVVPNTITQTSNQLFLSWEIDEDDSGISSKQVRDDVGLQFSGINNSADCITVTVTETTTSTSMSANHPITVIVPSSSISPGSGGGLTEIPDNEIGSTSSASDDFVMSTLPSSEVEPVSTMLGDITPSSIHEIDIEPTSSASDGFAMSALPSSGVEPVSTVIKGVATSLISGINIVPSSSLITELASTPLASSEAKPSRSVSLESSTNSVQKSSTETINLEASISPSSITNAPISSPGTVGPVVSSEFPSSETTLHNDLSSTSLTTGFQQEATSVSSQTTIHSTAILKPSPTALVPLVEQSVSPSPSCNSGQIIIPGAAIALSVASLLLLL